MHIESSKESTENDFSQSLKIKNESIICKDGFCSLPIQNDTSNISKDKVNLFDPI